MRRMTQQRKTILECLKQARRPLSATELLAAAARQIPLINLATIYRNIKILLEEKILVEVQLAGQAPRYEYNGLKEHHHFLCQACNRLYDIEESSAAPASTLPNGFKAFKCDVTLHGVCHECNY
ncbi:MAG: transcriptional repressor [Candidatus Protochlamydia sp.]|nr:transcriptional repressor [Candidatus Protochlamydia sp.]